MTLIITREEIRLKLLDWQSRQITERELHAWAEALYLNVDFNDWDADECNSVSCEVLSSLDCLDMNLITQEDIPIYLDFLKTAPEDFLLGYSKLNEYTKNIDYKQRQIQLKENDFYKPFCKIKL